MRNAVARVTWMFVCRSQLLLPAGHPRWEGNSTAADLANQPDFTFPVQRVQVWH